MKVAAYTTGKNFACSRLRIRQHIAELRQYGIDVTEYCSLIDGYSIPPKMLHYLTPLGINAKSVWDAVKTTSRIPSLLKSSFYDIAWLERGLHPKKLTNEHLLKNYIYDLDDALWTVPHYHYLYKYVERARIVFAGNTYIADWCTKYNSNIEIIPTPVDLASYDRFHTEPTAKEYVTIGWIGTRYNLAHFKALEEVFIQLQSEGLKIKLKIISDGNRNDLPFEKSTAINVEFTSWSEANELKDLSGIDIGLMPLPDNEFTRGKCSYKMLQYMGLKKPVIVSPVGMNGELLNKSMIGYGASDTNEWYQRLKTLIQNPGLMYEMGQNGYELVAKEYSLKVVSKKIADILTQYKSNK